MESLLQIKNYTYTYPNAPAPALADVSLSVAAGECVCVTGHSGCGKTTLLLAIKRLLHSGTATGTIVAGNADPDGNGAHDATGIVLQNAETQILCTTVTEEIAFGPENLCVQPDEISERMHAALEAVGLSDYRSRTTEQLSMGQKQRLAIASVLAMKPGILLLDEPTSQLDGPSKRRLLEVLKRLKHQGHALLITEHDLTPLQQIADRVLTMEQGTIGEMKQHPSEPVAAQTAHVAREHQSGGTIALAVTDISLAYPGTGDVFKGLNVNIAGGELVHLFGCNGSGKSSFLRCITGFLKPLSGSVHIAGISEPRPEQLLGKVGYLFQNPQRQIFEETVFAEVAFSLKRQHMRSGQIHSRVMEVLSLCAADHLVDRSPLTLSFGEQHRVALASVLAPRPDVLLLDEPFSGIDFAQRHKLLGILAELRSRFNTTVIIASHDPLPDPHWADCIIHMENGTHGTC